LSETNKSLDQNTFSSLSRLYLFALGIIAFLVLISQIFIQSALDRNQFDAKIINIAGKQRMLSQKISKSILLWDSPLKNNRNHFQELNIALVEWEKAHVLLKDNLNSLPNSSKKEKLKKQFFEVDLEIKELLEISSKIKKHIGYNDDETDKWIKSFILKEPSFLNQMNLYVNYYENYASQKIKLIKRIEFIAFIFLLLLLCFEFKG